MWDYYEAVESLFSKDFKMESLSRSKLFKDDKNKILDCINGLKSQLKKNDFLSKFESNNIMIKKWHYFLMLCLRHNINTILCPEHNIRIMLCPGHNIKTMLCPGHNIRK
jgi:hypothetical protein